MYELNRCHLKCRVIFKIFVHLVYSVTKKVYPKFQVSSTVFGALKVLNYCMKLFVEQLNLESVIIWDNFITLSKYSLTSSNCRW